MFDQTQDPNCQRSECVDAIVGEAHLTLLPPKVNSSLQDKPFQQKKATYAKAPLYQVRALAELDKWNKKAVKTREEEIISWVEDQYS